MVRRKKTGWCSGSDIAIGMILVLKREIKDKAVRKIIYRKLIDALENNDWDCQNEAEGEDPVFNEALHEMHPEWEGQNDN
jgi:hypothetical protein